MKPSWASYTAPSGTPARSVPRVRESLCLREHTIQFVKRLVEATKSLQYRALQIIQRQTVGPVIDDDARKRMY